MNPAQVHKDDSSWQETVQEKKYENRKTKNEERRTKEEQEKKGKQKRKKRNVRYKS